MSDYEHRPYNPATIRDAHANEVVLPSLFFTEDFADRLAGAGQELYLNEDEIIKGAINLGLHQKGKVFFSGSEEDTPLDGQAISPSEGIHRLKGVSPTVIFDAPQNTSTVLFEPGSDFNPSFWASTLAINYIPEAKRNRGEDWTYANQMLAYRLARFGLVGATGLPVVKAVQEHAHEPASVAVVAGLTVGWTFGIVFSKTVYSRVKSIYVRPAISNKKVDRLADSFPVFTAQEEATT